MDFIIVGTGLAGLHCAMKLSQKYPKKKILMLESYTSPGGRVATVKKNSMQWEAGAGRIPTSHKLISMYCDRYRLTRFPISNESLYADANGLHTNVWHTIVTVIKSILTKIPKERLGYYTVHEILSKFLNKEIVEDFLSYFPYRSEMTTMRADLAFSKEFSKAETFYGIKEGLSAITNGMLNELISRGVTILYEHKVTGVNSTKSFPMEMTVRTPFDLKIFKAQKIIFAVHANALRKIHPFSRYPILNHLAMTPLYRIYSIFPKVQKKVWFEGMPRIVTRNPLRHIIPIRVESGLIMTSYTDADDTDVWHSFNKGKDASKGKDALNKELVHQLQTLFPSKIIPMPTSTSSHYWEDGCTYWKPGSYDPVKESRAIMRPLTNLPDVYVCGESYSLKQAWMEGALEHADALIHHYFHRF